MSRIDELIREYCPKGVEYKTLEELGNLYGGLTGKSKDDFKDGNARFITYMNVFSNLAVDTSRNDFVKIKSDERQRKLEKGDVLFTGSSENPDECGMSSVVVEDPTEPLYLNSFCFIFRLKNTDIFVPDFLKYLFRDTAIRKQISKTASGVTRFNVSKKRFSKVVIPIPPLEVQKEIASILDKFTQLEAELSTELDVRRKQYDYYRKRLFELDSSTRTIKLTKACQKITTGKLNANAKDEGGAFPFFTCDATPYRINTYAFDTEAILVSGNGSQVGHINYYKGKFNAYQRTYILSEFSNEIDVKYLLLYLNAFLRDYIYKHSKKGSVPYITLPMLQNFEIPLPSKSDQLRIAEALGAFDDLVNNNSKGIPAEIKARRKQYEYYRTKLLTFQELSA